ncbi:hypothetical protein FACS189472_01780 [Alphaproteobacteria bacterium]|nr:hypothetical protein FACS189472_01780 [Alphaproteobacteria bacterium]
MTKKISNMMLVFVFLGMGAMHVAAMDSFPKRKMASATLAKIMRGRVPVVHGKMTLYVSPENVERVSNFLKDYEGTDGCAVAELSGTHGFCAAVRDDSILKDCCHFQMAYSMISGCLESEIQAVCDEVHYWESVFNDKILVEMCRLHMTKVADGDSPYQGIFEIHAIDKYNIPPYCPQ